VLHCLVVEEAIQDQQVRQVAVVAVAEQQEFCSTILYCLLLAVVAEVVAVADSVLGNQHLVQAAKPPTVYMRAKMDKIILATVEVVVEVVAAGLGVMAAQSEEVMSEH
jgi:hypothetical protein